MYSPCWRSAGASTSVYQPPPPGETSRTDMSWRKPKNCSVSFGCRYLSRARFASLRWSPARTLSSVASVAASVTGGSAAAAAKAPRQASAAAAARRAGAWVNAFAPWLAPSGGAILFEIRVAGKFRLVEALERLPFGDRESTVAHRALAVAREARVELARIVLHVAEHRARGVALDDLLDPPAVRVVEADVHDVRVAEQVVQVPEGLLVGADQERAEVILLARHELVHLERALGLALGDEAVDLAVRVAGDVGEHGAARRPLVEPVQRHDREQLVDGPAVRQRLEHRHVAEIDVGKDRLEVLELLRRAAELARQVPDLGAGRPVEPLGEAAHLDRQVADAEHLLGLLAGLLGVVPALHQAALADGRVRVVEVLDRLRQAAPARPLGHAEQVEARGAEHIEQEHAVVRRDRAPGLAQDHRVGQAARVADAGDPVDHVVRILAQRVVRGRLEVRARAVVVDAEAAADVDVLEPGAEARELRVHHRELVDRVLDAADVVKLGARVAMHELQAVEHAVRAEYLDDLEHLGREQAELGAVARRLAPAAGPLGRKLRAHADLGAHLVLFGVLQDVAELGEVLDDGDDRAAELGREDHGLDVVVVLEAVADDQALRRVAGHRHDGEQLGLAAGFEAEAEVRAAAVDLLDDEPP